MAGKELNFHTFSGGTITINQTACLDCVSKACIKNCVSSLLDPVLKIENGVPVLARADVKPESGWCVECMACELDCDLYGKKAVRIRYLEDLEL